MLHVTIVTTVNLAVSMNLIGSLDTPAVKVLSKGIVTSLDNSRPTLGPYGFADAFEDLFMDDPITRNIQTLM